MQRLVVYLGVFLLGLCGFVGHAYSQSSACALRVGNVAAETSETVSIPVTIHQAPNAVWALGIDLSFDPQVLQFTESFTRGDLVLDWPFFGVNLLEPGKLRIAGFSVFDSIPEGQSGTIVVLTFEVVCADCDPGSVFPIVPHRLTDSIAEWDACSGALHDLHCVDGQGLVVGDSSGVSGDRLSIPVALAEPNGALNPVTALGFDVIYDPQVLRFTGTFGKGELVDTWPFFDVHELEAGRLRVGGFTVTEALQAGDQGTIVRLDFEVLCDQCAEGDSSWLLASRLVDDVTGWSACPATFTSGCMNPGDVDQSGSVTPQDAMLVFEHFLRRTTLQGCGWEQADMDHSGNISPVDVMAIFENFLDQ